MDRVIRINYALASEAKAEADRLGMTLAGFVENALRMRLGRMIRIEELPVFDSGIRLPKGFDLKSLIDESP